MLALTDQGGDYYSVDFPATITIDAIEAYRIAIFLQAGANPAVSDYALYHGEIFWDGVEEIDVGATYGSSTTVTNVYNEGGTTTGTSGDLPQIIVINQ